MGKGPHNLDFDVVQGWEKLPEGRSYTEVVGVTADSRDRVFIFCRGEYPVMVFDKDGNFLDAWGAGDFVRPHGIYISAKDELFLVDDAGHSVFKYDLDGTLQMKIGEPEALLPGNFIAAHGLWVDSEGSLYVSEVSQFSGGARHYCPEDPMSAHSFQKFVRRG